MPAPCFCKRWAFNLQSIENEKFEKLYRRAVQFITPEDLEKVCAYMFKQDALSALVGRLFLRQATKRFTGQPWESIEFSRTERGKPYIVNPEGVSFGINLSHQGDYVLFAGSCTNNVGVDIMRLDMCRNNKTADEYIDFMERSASQEELKQMRSQSTELMKMTFFYRYWCLKEAMLKATGQGITEDLRRIDFRISPSVCYKQGCFLNSTYVLTDDGKQDQWVFEESFVDAKHVAAVCREQNTPSFCIYNQNSQFQAFFSEVDFSFLLEGATILNPILDDGVKIYQSFVQKPNKCF